MSYPISILIKSFVKQFYRENAGLFLFFITVMFLCVGPLNGAGLIEYHYSLIMGMLESIQFLLIVYALWLLYARKCLAFVMKKQFDPQYAFTYLLNSIGGRRRFGVLAMAYILLLAPIILYGLVVVVIAFYHHLYLRGAGTLCCLLLLFLAVTLWHAYQMNYAEKRPFVSWRPFSFLVRINTYPVILFSHICRRQAWLFTGIKIFTCGVLFTMARNNISGDYDIGYPFLFFNFGVMSNGIIVYRLRLFEETHLLFYRAMPVTLLRRWLNYALVHAVLLIPEWITIIALAPVHLHIDDAWRLGLCAYSVLLLLNAIYFLDDFSMKGYLRVLLVILCLEYFFVIAGALTAQYIIFFAAGIAIFFTGYYRFEKSGGQIGS